MPLQRFEVYQLAPLKKKGGYPRCITSLFNKKTIVFAYRDPFLTESFRDI